MIIRGHVKPCPVPKMSHAGSTLLQKIVIDQQKLCSLH